MGAIGAVGGIGGGLGSVGASSSGTSFDAGPAMAPEPAGSYTQGWFNSQAVMDTSGAVNGASVSLRDGDVSRAGVGSIGEDPRRQKPVACCQGVGDSPSGAVVDKVASVYAANRMS